MAYKDKDKQREANAERQRRYKARSKALAKGVTSEGVTDKALPVEPEVMVEIDNDGNITPVSGKPKRGKDIKCITIDDQAKSVKTMALLHGQMTVMERLFYRPASKLGRGDTNFVSLPGRACYGVV